MMHSVDELPEIMHVSDVAEALEISASTLYRIIEAGKIGYVRISKRNLRIRREHVIKYLEANTHEPQ